MKLYETKKVNIDTLIPADYNPRVISKDEFEGLKASLDTYGLLDDIVWNKRTGNIVGGHQRVEALKVLGYTEATIKEVDLDLKEEKKLNSTLNNLHIQGKYDDLKLAEILEELKLDDDYESLRLNKLEPLDLSNTSKEIDVNDLLDDSKTVICPKCNFEFEK